MTADQPPPAAVDIVRKAIARWFPFSGGDTPAADAVAALAERYAFVDHAEYARLVAVERMAQRVRTAHQGNEQRRALLDLYAALDAAPAGTTVRVYDQLTEQEGGPPNDRVNELPAPGVGLPHFCP
jgi:hypothetical protein